MNATLLVTEFKSFLGDNQIDRPTTIRLLEETFKTMVRKEYETDENVEVTINLDRGDVEIWRFRTIVDDDSEDIWDPDKIALTDAKKIQDDFEEGEEVSEQIILDKFGRRTIQLGIQTLKQKIKDLKKDAIFQLYKDKVGDTIIGEVAHFSGREIVVMDENGHDLILPRDKAIPKDRFHKGDHIKAIVDKVEKINESPRIELSRTSPMFLERLFEQEIPEVFDGIIAIKKVVREPGERAKVAVESYDDRVDPVGACVGVKGVRIQNIVRELENENIDVINYTVNTELFIRRALSPATVASITIDTNKNTAYVYLKPDQVSLAIGKNGHNIKLASRLVGMEIEAFAEPEGLDLEEDIDLQEFDDEIEQWIIDEFRRIGLDTARRVLAMSKDDLLRRTELEEETIDDVSKILRQEFEKDA
jgi:transcription termination/antitermination protein NusA